ncbi:calcium-binding protein [Tropicibacter naphthalenivorans]|uniref:Hemolysin, chromosomal n=1 Tax=Tropicibacter naphthalenivorans TaxID=441103 RepID=A0A0P1G4S9_9RHOB|nr:calcium-binding protein [Tropicibacter naphthalenivorans]CUH76687.1 Hemolysin, chromosomal [Tropicibacter naphthalenivorans]SMC64076.1 Hemolysin-type calcium-binding repeat-containing protein [Tropicibacter naphthalenivorans]
MTALLLILFGSLAIGSMVVSSVEDEINDRIEDAEDEYLDDEEIVYDEDENYPENIDTLGYEVDGGDADERLTGTDDDDSMSGGAGNDTIRAGDGNDEIYDDFYEGVASGDDAFYGGSGDDTLTALDGADSLYGGLGNDELVAIDVDVDVQPDWVSGGYGNDTLVGDSGDVLLGGEGDDLFVVSRFDDADDPVQIADYEASDTILVYVYQSGLLANDGTDVVEAVEHDDSTAIYANGIELARVEGPDHASLTFELIDVTA